MARRQVGLRESFGLAGEAVRRAGERTQSDEGLGDALPYGFGYGLLWWGFFGLWWWIFGVPDHIDRDSAG